MHVYWIVLFLGAIIAPWVAMGGSLRRAFRERGLAAGLGLWLGIAIITTPVIFAIVLMGQLFLPERR